MRHEQILNPVTGATHRVRIVQPNGFEFAEAVIGRGWSKTEAPVAFDLEDCCGQVSEIHLCQSGMVREAGELHRRRGAVPALGHRRPGGPGHAHSALMLAAW